MLRGRIISMPDSKRLAACRDSWAAVLDEVSVFPAVIGREVDDLDPRVSTELFTRLKATSTWNPFCWESDMMHHKAQIGCALSHIALWRECVETDAPLVVIEDDVVVRASRAAIEAQLDGADLVSLIYLSSHRTARLAEAARTFYGAQAYYLTPRAARLLLREALPLSLHIDKYIGYVAWRHATDWRCAQPKLKHTCKGASTLSHQAYPKIVVWAGSLALLAAVLATLVTLLWRCRSRCGLPKK